MRRDSRVQQICERASRTPVRRWPARAALGLALTALWAAPAAAQTWGAKGGLNLSTVTFEDVDTTAEASAVAGGFVRFPFVAGLRLQIEGLFAQRRITFEDLVRDELNYVEIPVLARYQVFSAGGRPVHVLGGAVIGFRLSADEVIGGESVDVKEAYEPIDLGVSIGGEVAITRRWLVDVRYVVGLTNANDVPGLPVKVRFRTLQITAGFGF